MKFIVDKIIKVSLKYFIALQHFLFFFVLVIKPSLIHCPTDQLFLTIQLNGIDPNDVLLGDRSCKTNWSNATHAQFISHINNCSLVWNRIS